MDVYAAKGIAKLLRNNPYPGRGIVIGKTPDGRNACVAYFIMGRSANSRNRVFSLRDGLIKTEPFEPEKVEDPSLIIYNAVRWVGDSLLVTNGDQTDTIAEYLSRGKTFEQALSQREFEPDAPNFTPRISGILDFNGRDFTYRMSILKSADREGTACNRFTFAYAPLAGIGHFLHTYVSDGMPLPTFTGEPERIRTENDIDAFTAAVWESLDSDNKISLAVRYVSLATGKTEDRIVNRNTEGNQHEKV